MPLLPASLRSKCVPSHTQTSRLQQSPSPRPLCEAKTSVSLMPEAESVTSTGAQGGRSLTTQAPAPKLQAAPQHGVLTSSCFVFSRPSASSIFSSTARAP